MVRILLLVAIMLGLVGPAFGQRYSLSLQMAYPLYGKLQAETKIAASTQLARIDARYYLDSTTLGPLGLGLSGGLQTLVYEVNEVKKDGYGGWLGLSLARVFSWHGWEHELGSSLIPFSYFTVSSASDGLVNSQYVRHASAIALKGQLGLDLDYRLNLFRRISVFGQSFTLKYGAGLSFLHNYFNEKTEITQNSKGQSVSKKDKVKYSLSVFFFFLHGGFSF